VVKLEEIYRDIVLEHSRHPRNKGVLEHATIHEHGSNPSCGDELELHLQMKGDRIERARFTGVGCAISQASASLMTVILEGKTRVQALELAQDFHAMLHGQAPSERLGEVAALQGVAKLHARVKCATLPWQTLEAALQKKTGTPLE
jgi:nitrogen fixation protein NifU and related proteins